MHTAAGASACASPSVWRWIGWVLLFAVPLVASSCWSESPLSPTDLGGPNDLGEPDPAQPIRRAYHLLQQTDLRGPDWPDKFKDYDLFVCNAAMSAADLNTIRAAIPGAKLLASTSAQDAAIGVSRHPYYGRLEAQFDSSRCIRDLNTGNVVRLWPWDPENPGAGTYPAFVMSRRAAQNLVGFHYYITMPAGWDGLYIDMCTREFPSWKMANLETVTSRYDIDDDGIADTREDIQRQYEQWRPFFTATLRLALPDAIIIGNTGGPLVDAALNGITLERVGSKHTVAEAKDYLLAQEGVARFPPLSALWVSTTDDAAPSLGLARQYDWVYLGDAR